MAIRQNPSLPNRHTGYLAKSGYGKSQALKQNPDIPKQGARVILWDPALDHKANRFTRHAEFKKAVSAGIRSGRGFRLALVGNNDPEEFEWFCEVCWNALDGQNTLHIMIEELAAVQPSAGRAAQFFGLLCNQSRKFGGILHWTTQRSQEISKTVLDQTENFYIGYPSKLCSKPQVEKLARIAECSPGELLALDPLQFYRVTPQKSELITLKYKNI